MLVDALFDPLSVAVLAIVLGMIGLALAWYSRGRGRFDELRGGLKVLRNVGRQLAPDHPIRKRLESAPVVDLSFEEIARLMAGDRVEPAARTLIELQAKTAWIERFAQYSVHLGILGTVFALVSSDPTDLESFRAGLPMALGTTFWGLVGALALSAAAGACEGMIERARLHVREALLEGLEVAPAPREDATP
ncbi:MAG TPA: MotA/TolQ/ExbB proton channel family protein [Nannocystaceae bacterium]|nr:MotA/TolQ/ExbB proton channel family protein [Nannocystaceae bacterium]